MRIEIAADQRALEARTRALAQTEIKARATEANRIEADPWDNVERLKQAGFISVTIPRSLGGESLGWMDAGGVTARADRIGNGFVVNDRLDHGWDV